MASQSHSTEKQRWYAVYTKPRWEKKVTFLLQEKEVECYCPLNKVRRKWSDRIKTVEEPLFKSYVFVKVRESEMTSIRMTNGVVNFVYWNGRPANIKEKEIDTIRRFLNDYSGVEVTVVDLPLNAKVLIQRGAFMEKEGIVKKVMHKKIQVSIESIGYILTAYIDRSNVTLVQRPSRVTSLNKKS
jgi:transcription antitermination factor NusG